MRKVKHRRRPMTTVIGMICDDGLVIGSDTKTVGGDIKYSEKKIETFKLGKSPLLAGEAGTVRHCRDAISWMGLDSLQDKLGKDQSFNNFVSQAIEYPMPRFVRDYKLKYGEEPDLEMLIGCIDEIDKPQLLQIYSDAEYEHIENYAAIGTGSIFGELLLRKLYYKEITIAQAERLTAYLIWEIQEVDDSSGEDMQIVSIDRNRKRREVSFLEIETYKQLPKVIIKAYIALGEEIRNVDLEVIKKAVQGLNRTIVKSIIK